MRPYRILVIILLLLLGAMPCLAGKQKSQSEPMIKVGLAVGQKQLSVSADAAFFLIGETSSDTKPYVAKEKVVISMQEGRLAVNGMPVTTTVLRVVFAASTSRGHGDQLEQANANAASVNRQGQFTQLNGKRYRGLIEIRRQPGKTGLTAVNTLPLEAYLYGVVPKEISPVWQLEALKAQAVAARSYAFASVGKHQDQGFDVCTTVHCQVYGGLDSEAITSNQAVDETRGMMVTYKGNVITAFFHASSGGHTESSENVWGSPVPYLRGVPDFDQASPRFTWERRESAKKFTDLLRVNGYDIGNITAIEVTPLTRQPVVAADRGISGRLKKITIKGTAGRVQLTGGKMISLLGLPSTLFDVDIIRNGDNSVAANTQSSLHTVQNPEQDILLIRGQGSGHGIGLSQWGAKAMADSEKTGNNQFYKDILAHYYSGAIVQQWYQ